MAESKHKRIHQRRGQNKQEKAGSRRERHRRPNIARATEAEVTPAEAVRDVDEGDQPRRDDSQDIEHGNGGPHGIER